MSNVDDAITRSTAVPNWMVYGAVALIVVLSGGPVGQVVMTSHHVYELQSEMGERKREIKALEVKQQDFIAMFNEISKNINDLSRKMPP